jgi:hypothetical protein
VDDGQAAVVYPGTDHRLNALRPTPSRPSGLAEQLDGPFIVALGTDYRHKNRLFALRLLDELRRQHGWDGSLVLAGPHVPHGSSAGEEAAFLTSRPQLASVVFELGSVSEAEKRWLLEQAAAVVYSTVYEGFGLIPFEAGEAGTPCLFAPHTSLSEILPSMMARLVPWDAAASADRVINFIDGAERADFVEQLRQLSAPYTWRRSAEETVAVYEHAAADASRSRRLVSIDEAVSEDEGEADERYEELVTALGEHGLALVGPNGVLPEDMHRPLLAIATRRWLRWPIFGLVRAPYRIAYRFLHGGRAAPRTRA